MGATQLNYEILIMCPTAGLSLYDQDGGRKGINVGEGLRA